MDYNVMSDGILKSIGGRDNVKHVYHCVTRLRFELKDESLYQPDKAVIVPDVLGAFLRFGEYQFVIGAKVPEVYKAVLRRLQ